VDSSRKSSNCDVDFYTRTKRSGEHSHDRVAVSVEHNGIADDLLIGGESLLRQSVTQNHGALAAGGFIVTGTHEKRVLVRAIGPSLSLSDRLADPILELHDSSGQTIAINDNWVDAPNQQAIIDTTIPPSNNLESAILMSLAPGAYTATVRGVNNTTGIGLVETYDLDRSVNSRLVNMSTRGLVQTSDNVLIAGMIVLGHTPQTVIVRAIGPSLSTRETGKSNSGVTRRQWRFDPIG
jgi:hypothetical protein